MSKECNRKLREHLKERKLNITKYFISLGTRANILTMLSHSLRNEVSLNQVECICFNLLLSTTNGSVHK